MQKEKNLLSQAIPFPFFVLFAIVAFNITMFALVLQTGVLVFYSPTAKMIAWTLTAIAWGFVYVFRNK